MSAPASGCVACKAASRSAFCARCWRLADRSARYEMAWWHGEFRAALSEEDAAFAFACWHVVASWLGGVIREALERRQAARVLRKAGAKKRPKSLAELALEAEDNPE